MEIKTERLAADGDGIARAAEILRGGGIVALPTETVYGLGANALDESAVARIFAAKERPNWDPLIVHIVDEEMLSRVVRQIPEAARRLMWSFWPGPLTLLLPKAAAIPTAVTAGRDLVGVRMPAHPVAAKLIRAAGVPVAAPSANRFGRTSPTSAVHVLEDLDGRIDAVLDGGETSVGVESTVVDASQSPLVIYRPGAVTEEMIRAVAGEVVLFQPPAPADAENVTPESLPSPGVGIRHYAPRATLMLVSDEAELREKAVALLAHGERVGVMLPDGWEAAGEVFAWGAWNGPEMLAQRLFAGLRDLDRRGVTVILCPLPAEAGLGRALQDRLRKAARPR